MEEGVDVEAFYVCDFCRKFGSPGQPCRGVHQDSQICDENHIFVMSLAFFWDGFSKFFVFATHKINSRIAPFRATSFISNTPQSSHVAHPSVYLLFLVLQHVSRYNRL